LNLRLWPTVSHRGNIPWEVQAQQTAADDRYAAVLTPYYMFPLLASHQYALTLSARTAANFDTQRVSMQVSGLQAVPEPATLWLLGTGGAFMAIRRWRHRARGHAEVEIQ
jgi:hypothetical protein